MRFPERKGIASRMRPDGFLVWFHAASIGESLSVAPLAERLLAERPDTQILVTSGTVTSAGLLNRRLGTRVIHQYAPVDRRVWVERFLDHWRPDCAIWVESEIWPNMLRAIALRGIPAALLNARMSSRSHARWSRAPATIAQLLRTFEVCLAQTSQEAERLRRLGARDPGSVGHLKYAADKLTADPRELDVLRGALADRPFWVLASSHEGEEAVAIAAHHLVATQFPNLLTVIVPRHIQRARSISAAARKDGLTAALRSTRPPDRRDAVYVVDAMGELGLWYRLTTVACIGGSLVPVGGHNPIEAAQLDCALLYGSHMFSMAEIASELEQSGAAIVVADASALASALTRLLGDPAVATAMARAGREVAARNANVIDRAFAILDPLIDRAQRRRQAS